MRPQFLARDEVRALHEDDAFGDVVVAYRRIVLTGERHLHDRALVEAARELRQALLGIRMRGLRNRLVLGLDLELHCRRSFRDDDALNLTNGPHERDHPNAPRAEPSARRSAGVGGRSGRVHVVDDAHVGRHRLARGDASSDVPPPLGDVQAASPRGGSG
jgi:hypothetical protein